MAKIVFHIGAHKTGTTAIQLFLDKYSNRILKSNILYPKSARYHHAQHRLAFGLAGMKDPAKGDIPDPKEEAHQINEEISREDCPTVLISSEEFFSLPREKVMMLNDLFCGHELHALAYIRRPDFLYESSYNQKAKEPKNKFAFQCARHRQPNVHIARYRLQNELEVMGDSDRHPSVYSPDL